MSPFKLLHLKKNWQNTVSSFNVGHSDLLFNQLVALYSDPRRKYHNLDHIYDCIRWAEKLSDSHPQNPHRERINIKHLCLGIWFHDCIYTFSPGDEIQSSIFFKTSFADFTSFDVSEVCEMIEATANHISGRDSLSINSKYLLDIDLSILGSSVSEYKAYCDKLREEYKEMGKDNSAFLPGRIKFLKSLKSLKEASIYNILVDLNDQARANISSELEKALYIMKGGEY